MFLKLITGNNRNEATRKKTIEVNLKTILQYANVACNLHNILSD